MQALFRMFKPEVSVDQYAPRLRALLAELTAEPPITQPDPNDLNSRRQFLETQSALFERLNARRLEFEQVKPEHRLIAMHDKAMVLGRMTLRIWNMSAEALEAGLRGDFATGRRKWSEVDSWSQTLADTWDQFRSTLVKLEQTQPSLFNQLHIPPLLLLRVLYGPEDPRVLTFELEHPSSLLLPPEAPQPDWEHTEYIISLDLKGPSDLSSDAWTPIEEAYDSVVAQHIQQLLATGWRLDTHVSLASALRGTGCTKTPDVVYVQHVTLHPRRLTSVSADQLAAYFRLKGNGFNVYLQMLMLHAEYTQYRSTIRAVLRNVGFMYDDIVQGGPNLKEAHDNLEREAAENIARKMQQSPEVQMWPIDGVPPPSSTSKS